jgi:hypothetical protein
MQDANYTIRSLDGKLIAFQTSNRFDSTLFANGIYLVTISSEGKHSTKKLLIQN